MDSSCPECTKDVRNKKRLTRLYHRVGAGGTWKRTIGYGFCKYCGKVFLVDGDK